MGFQRCKAPVERESYTRMTQKFGWPKNILIHQIESRAYEATLLSQVNLNEAVTPELRSEARLAVKNDHTFDSIELGEPHAERGLKRSMFA